MSIIKQAEQNAIKEAKFWTDFVNFVDALQLNAALSADPNRDAHYGLQKIREGLALVKQGAYEEMHYAIARCFIFVGVGGKDAQAYSSEQAKKWLKGIPVDWLDEHFRLPGYWRAELINHLKDELDKVQADRLAKEN